jgi:hypothetical protein
MTKFSPFGSVLYVKVTTNLNLVVALMNIILLRTDSSKKVVLEQFHILVLIYNYLRYPVGNIKITITFVMNVM